MGLLTAFSATHARRDYFNWALEEFDDHAALAGGRNDRLGFFGNIRLIFCMEMRLSRAMEMIVAGYVKVNNRRALADLLGQRSKVLAQLQAVSGINPQNAVQAIQEELELIEAGLEKLKPFSGSLPENERS
ncbi:hypothetical protein ACVWXN_000465 [Bradyrhizobium sp. i1.4.4]|nr:hypothetical protein [Bradyrhizobium japonicum]